MKTVRFTQSILVQGEHCEAGSTREIPAIIAGELIAAGSAVETEKRETANLKTSKREKAAK